MAELLAALQELGFGGAALGDLALEVGGFANFIQDFIYAVPVPGESDPASGFQVYDITQGDARLLGFETTLDYHPTPYLHFHGTADFVRGDNTTTGSPLPDIPPFRATYQLRVEGGRTGRVVSEPYVSLGAESHVRQTRLDPAQATFFAQAFDGAGFTPAGYTLLQVGAGFRLRAGRTPVRFDLTLRNALNQRYADFLSRIKTNAPDPGMGRALITRVSADF